VKRDARAKLIALLAVLAGIATSPVRDATAPAALTLLLLMASAACGLSARSIAFRALIVSALSLPFAVMIALTGDSARALALCARVYGSGVAVLLFAGVTPSPELFRALRWFRVPVLLVEVIQFVHRYLFVIADQARRMRTAAGTRGRLSVKASGGVLAVLFARSYERAENIHRAMLSRGYAGQIPALSPSRAGTGDAVFILLSIAAVIAVRAAAARV
jgi:cobalt/nickel transport system permease protein